VQVFDLGVLGVDELPGVEGDCGPFVVDVPVAVPLVADCAGAVPRCAVLVEPPTGDHRVCGVSAGHHTRVAHVVCRHERPVVAGCQRSLGPAGVEAHVVADEQQPWLVGLPVP